jgi:hypothetical protein
MAVPQLLSEPHGHSGSTPPEPPQFKLQDPYILRAFKEQNTNRPHRPRSRGE